MYKIFTIMKPTVVTLSQVNELVPRWSWTTASSCTWSFVDFGIDWNRANTLIGVRWGEVGY